MAMLHTGDCVVGHLGQVDELITHIDEGHAFAFSAQGEIEDPAVPGERFVDVADLDGDMIDADETWLAGSGHGSALCSVVVAERRVLGQSFHFGAYLPALAVEKRIDRPAQAGMRDPVR